MKTYEITICNETFNLNREEIKTILTETAFKFFWRTHLQGGDIKFGIGSVKEYFKHQFQKEEATV